MRKIVQCEENDTEWCSEKIAGLAKIYSETYEYGLIYTIKEARGIGQDLKPILVFSQARSMLSKQLAHQLVLHIFGYSYYVLSFVDDKHAEIFHREWFEETKIPIIVPPYVEPFLGKLHDDYVSAETDDTVLTI